MAGFDVSVAIMPPSFQIELAEEVPDDARVCHYDELDEPAKHRLPAVTGSTDSTTSDPAFETAAEACDVVKFTEYYRIERL